MEGERRQVIQLSPLPLHTVTRSKSGVDGRLAINKINPKKNGTPGDDAEGISTTRQREKILMNAVKSKRDLLLL